MKLIKVLLCLMFVFCVIKVYENNPTTVSIYSEEIYDAMAYPIYLYTVDKNGITVDNNRISFKSILNKSVKIDNMPIIWEMEND